MTPVLAVRLLCTNLTFIIQKLSAGMVILTSFGFSVSLCYNSIVAYSELSTGQQSLKNDNEKYAWSKFIYIPIISSFLLLGEQTVCRFRFNKRVKVFICAR